MMEWSFETPGPGRIRHLRALKSFKNYDFAIQKDIVTHPPPPYDFKVKDAKNPILVLQP